MKNRISFELKRLFLSKYIIFIYIGIVIASLIGLIILNFLHKDLDRKYKVALAQQISVIQQDLQSRYRTVLELEAIQNKSNEVNLELAENKEFIDLNESYVTLAKDELLNYSKYKLRVPISVQRANKAKKLIDRQFQSENMFTIRGLTLNDQMKFFKTQEIALNNGIEPIKTPYEVNFQNMIKVFFGFPISFIWPIITLFLIGSSITSEFETGAYKNLYSTKDSRTKILVSKIIVGWFISISFIIVLILSIMLGSLIFSGFGNFNYPFLQVEGVITTFNFIGKLSLILIFGSLLLTTIITIISCLTKSFDTLLVIFGIIFIINFLAIKLNNSFLNNKANILSFFNPTNYISYQNSSAINFNCILMLVFLIIVGSIFTVRFSKEDL